MQTENQSGNQREFANELLDQVAHDLRAGLVPLKTHPQMLATGMLGPLTEKQMESVAAIERCVQKQVDKIGAVLDLIKSQEKRLELQTDTANFPELVQRAIKPIERDAKRRNITIHSDIEPGAALIEADATRLERILTSLLNKCLQQSSERGAIGVEVRYVAKDKARLRIWDNGAGNDRAEVVFLTQSCAEQVQSRISGQKFPEIDLAAMFDIIRLHQGALAVSTEKGFGTTYVITLPVTRKAAGTLTQETAGTLIFSGDGPRNAKMRDIFAKLGIDAEFVDSEKDLIQRSRQRAHQAVIIEASDPKKLIDLLKSDRPDENTTYHAVSGAFDEAKFESAMTEALNLAANTR